MGERWPGERARLRHSMRVRNGVHPDDAVLEPPPGQCCEVCGAVPDPEQTDRRKGRNVHFDHDHETGRFRGWLCFNCNQCVGLIEKYGGIDHLYAAVRYLEERGARTVP